MNEIHAILQSEYGITVNNIYPVIGGWSASAYKVEAAQGTYFLKAYEKKKSGTSEQLEKLNLCMAVSSWLENNTRLQGRINAPLLTKQGYVRAETKDYAYLLFSYIDGVTPRTTPLSNYQQEELAKIVGELHCHSADIPFDLSSIQETYEIPCSELMKIKHIPNNDSLCVYRQYDMLMKAIVQANKLAEYVKAEKPNFVLCHTDIHGWNLMQSDRLILIDWESIKYAPAEADLFAFWGDWYWGDSKWGSYWDTFLPVYQRLCKGYSVREELLRFYQIRRHIEDVDAFYRQYIYDDMTEEETSEVVTCLERECKLLNLLTKKQGNAIKGTSIHKVIKHYKQDA